MVVSLMEKQDVYLIQHQISMDFGSKIDLLKCSSHQEKLLKFEVEGREFTKSFFHLFLGVSPKKHDFLTKSVKILLSKSIFYFKNCCCFFGIIFNLKVSRSQNKIVQMQILPKIEQTNLFFYLDYYSG